MINQFKNLKLRLSGISIGKRSFIISPYYITGNVNIGNDCSINHNVTIDALPTGLIIIGDNTSVGPNTVIRACNHDYLNLIGHTEGSIIIGSNVWIGANCVILPNVSIGCGSVIGAGSIVTKSIPENVVAVGNPCKPIKNIKRF